MKYGVSTDCWTSNQTTPYVTYTLHFIDDSGLSILSFVLSTVELPGKHTEVNLRNHIKKTLLEWGLFGDTVADSDIPVVDLGDVEEQDEELTFAALVSKNLEKI